MWFQLDVDDLLVLGSCDRDGGGNPNFNRCVDGGQHCVFLGVGHGDDEVYELGGVILADMRDYVHSVWCGLKRGWCAEEVGGGCGE